MPEQVARMKFGEGILFSQEDTQFLSFGQTGFYKLDNGSLRNACTVDASESTYAMKYFALHPLSKLQNELNCDSRYADDYCMFMQDVIEKRFAECSQLLNVFLEMILRIIFHTMKSITHKNLVKFVCSV